MNEDAKITNEWDKVFKKSDMVNHKKVTFHNRFGITLVGDLYEPLKYEGKLPGVAICGPFGAVKEQSSGLYAQTLAEMGYITLAFDPSFTGESGGVPRYVASPDINTEDFQSAVDYLSVQDNIDSEKIGIIGICGWGGIALNTASIDTRVKVTITSTMYDMSRVNHNGYFDALNEDEIYTMKENLNKQRIKDYKSNTFELGGGVVDPLPEDAPFYVKDYYDYYKTKRGYHERSLNSNGGWNITSSLSFINTKQLEYTSEIRNAVLIIHGEKAHSCYFSTDAYNNMINNSNYKDNKKLLIIPGAVHTDLYDKLDIIPFDEIDKFLKEYLK